MKKQRKKRKEVSPETRRKLSESAKAVWATVPADSERRKAWNKGKKLPSRPLSEETRKKMSESAKKAWANTPADSPRRKSWNTGLSGDAVLTPEGRKRKAEAARKQWTGIPKSEETRRKMSESLKGHPGLVGRPPNAGSFKKGQDAWNKGIPCREETKQKLSEKLKGRPINAGSFKKGQVAPTKGMEFPERRGENNNMWKGGITPEHARIRTSAKFLRWREQVFKRDNWTCQICGQRGGDLHAHHILPFSIYPALRMDVDNGVTLCKRDHRMIHRIASTKVELEN